MYWIHCIFILWVSKNLVYHSIMRTNNTDNNSIQLNGVIFSTVSEAEESDTSPGLSIIRGGQAIVSQLLAQAWVFCLRTSGGTRWFIIIIYNIHLLDMYNFTERLIICYVDSLSGDEAQHFRNENSTSEWLWFANSEVKWSLLTIACRHTWIVIGCCTSAGVW